LCFKRGPERRWLAMRGGNSILYLIGAVVVIIVVLRVLGLI
jgi:hypothetical protein